MTMPRRGHVIAFAVLVLGAGGFVGFRGWQAGQRAALVAPLLHVTPDLGRLPADVRTELARLLGQARNGDVAALARASRILHANGYLAEAMRCYAALEKLEPSEPRWPHRHATIAAGFGDTAPAIERWRRTLALAPDYPAARLRLAELLLKSDRPNEAAAEYRAVLQRQPDDPHASLGLARIDVEAQRWAPARERLEKIVAQTGYALGYDLIVTVYEQLGLSPQAAAVRARAKASGAYRDFNDPWLAELLDECHDPYQLALAAGVADRSGESARAIVLLERAAALAPDAPAVRFQLAGVHTQRRDVTRARAELERCTTIAPEFADGWAHLSALLEQAGDHSAAERTLANGLRHCPESPGLHLMRARLARKSGNLPAAIEAYRRSLQLRPNEAEGYVELATLLLQVERGEEALGHLHRAIEVEPDHPAALSLLTLTAISAGDEPAARRWLQRAEAQPRIAPAQLQQLQHAYRGQFRR